MSHLIFALAVLESLNICINSLSDLMFLHFFHFFFLLLCFNLSVEESLSFHLFFLSLISLTLFSLSFLLSLLLGMMLNSVQILLELIVSGNTSSYSSLAWSDRVIHFLLNKFDTFLINFCQLASFIVLLWENWCQNVIWHLGSTFNLFFSLIDLSTELNLLLVRCKCSFFLLSFSCFFIGFFILQVLEYALQLLGIPLLFLLSEVLSSLMFLNLSIADNLLLFDHLSYVILLILLFAFLLLFLRPDELEVLKVTFLLLGLGMLLLLHLFLEFKAYPHLIFFDLHLDGVFFLLELLHVVHYNFCPIVAIFSWGSGMVGMASRAQNLVSNFLNGRRAGSLRGVGKRFQGTSNTARILGLIQVLRAGSSRINRSTKCRRWLPTFFNQLIKTLVKLDQVVFSHLIVFKEAGNLWSDDSIDVIFICNDVWYVFSSELINQKV